MKSTFINNGETSPGAKHSWTISVAVDCLQQPRGLTIVSTLNWPQFVIEASDLLTKVSLSYTRLICTLKHTFYDHGWSVMCIQFSFVFITHFMFHVDRTKSSW